MDKTLLRNVVGVAFLSSPHVSGNITLKVLSGGDACGGNTRSHPEHDGEDPCGRWYYAGDGMGEQAAARHYFYKTCFTCDEHPGILPEC